MIKHNKFNSVALWIVQLAAVALVCAGCGGSGNGADSKSTHLLASTSGFVDTDIVAPTGWVKTNSFQISWHATLLPDVGDTSGITNPTIALSLNSGAWQTINVSSIPGGNSSGIGGAKSMVFQQTNMINGVYQYRITACGNTGSKVACSTTDSGKFTVLDSSDSAALTVLPKLSQAFLYPNPAGISGAQYFAAVTLGSSTLQNDSALAANGDFQTIISDVETGSNHGPKGTFSRWLAGQNVLMGDNWINVGFYNDKELGIGRGVYCNGRFPPSGAQHAACYIVNCGDATDLTNDRFSQSCNILQENLRNDNSTSTIFVGKRPSSVPIAQDLPINTANPPQYFGFDKTDQQLIDLTQRTRDLDTAAGGPTVTGVPLNPAAAGSPTLAHNKASLAGLPGAAVAMEWDSDDTKNPVKFFAFDYKRNFATGRIQLDGVSSADVPGNCTTCHSGYVYRDSSGAINTSGAHFLPLDINNMYFFSDTDRANAKGRVGAINKTFVARTEGGTGGITNAINGYLDPYAAKQIPDAWTKDYYPDPVNQPNNKIAAADVTAVFNTIVRPRCSSCHLARGSGFVTDPGSFFGPGSAPGSGVLDSGVSYKVCGATHTMPRAQVAEDNFYKDDAARKLLRRIFGKTLNIPCML